MRGDIAIVRSGGDIASGIIQKLHRSGFRVLVLETDRPTSIRRAVCFSEAVFNGTKEIEGLTSVLVKNDEEIANCWNKDLIPLIVDPNGEYIGKIKPLAVIDAILAKKNLGMNKSLAHITIAVGPGFEAGKDVHIVVESQRGHDLGRLIFNGMADKNTGKPGNIGGFTVERVLYSPCYGTFYSNHKIGDVVKKGDVVATVDDEYIYSKIDGMIRGLLRNGIPVTKGFKVGDVDPRAEQVRNCFTISDKARAIGGAVLEAVMIGKLKYE